jgi:protein-S-isoprenylcysteine O-methyltransferase Ste14
LSWRERLARYRVRIGFVAAPLVLWLAQPTRATIAYGAAVVAIGEGLRLWAAGHLEKGREVTASGPYRFTRHPLYMGSSIIGGGFAIASASIPAAVLVLGYLGLTITSAIRSEERHLTEKFGEAYPRYREGRGPTVERRFSLARAMANREHRTIAGIGLALALLSWKMR